MLCSVGLSAYAGYTTGRLQRYFLVNFFRRLVGPISVPPCTAVALPGARTGHAIDKTLSNRLPTLGDCSSNRGSFDVEKQDDEVFG